jgi:hypothetical protein
VNMEYMEYMEPRLQLTASSRYVFGLRGIGIGVRSLSISRSLILSRILFLSLQASSISRVSARLHHAWVCGI